MNSLKSVSEGSRFSFKNLTNVQENTLFSSATKGYDRNLTEVAHSFSKHAGRHPETWGKLTGSMDKWHNQAFDRRCCIIADKQRNSSELLAA